MSPLQGSSPRVGPPLAWPERRLAAGACLWRALGPRSPLCSTPSTRGLFHWPVDVSMIITGLSRWPLRGSSSLLECSPVAPQVAPPRGLPATVAVLPSAEVRAAGSSQAEAPHCPAGRARRKDRGLHKGMPSRKLVCGEPQRTSTMAGWGPEVGGGGETTSSSNLKMGTMDRHGFCCLVAQSCPTLCDPTDYDPPGSSVHGISQERILEWVAISFSRGSSPPRD